MKNIFRFLMAVAILFTASCAKEDISSSIAGGEVEVTFTANLPELGTRAYGEGKLVDILYYNVYEQGKDIPLDLSGYQKAQTQGQSLYTITLPMIKGMKYDIVFWAQVEDCGYYTLDGKTVTVNYAGKANDEKRDAFFGKVVNFNPVNPGDMTSVELRRPFAQLNAITNDCQAVLKSSISEMYKSSLKVTTPVCDTLDLLTGEASGTASVEYTLGDIPAETKTITKDETTEMHLAMNYLLVNGEKSLVDVEFTFVGLRGTEVFTFTPVKLGNIPVQRNYRTNIIGKLLTKTTDFEVEIKPGFDTPDQEPNALVKAAINGGEFTLTEDVVLESPLNILADLTINLNGKTISAAVAKGDGAVIEIAEGVKAVISGGTVESTNENGDAAINNAGELVLQNVTIEGAPIGDSGYPNYAIYTSGQMTIEDGCSITSDRGVIYLQNGADLTINGGNISVTNALGSRALTAHVIYAYGNTSKLTINGGNFALNYEAAGNLGASVICPAGATINVYGGNFNYAGVQGNQSGIFQNYMGYGAPVKVYGGTYNDSTVNKNVATGYKAIEKNGLYYVVSNDTDNIVANKTDLQNVLKDAVAAGTTDVVIDAAGANIGNLNDGFSNGNVPTGTTVTIRNAKVTEASKWNYVNGTIIFENCEFTAGLYSIHFDDTDGVGDVIFKKCKLVGWVPFGAIHSVSFEDCHLTGNGSYALIRSYANLSLKNCVIDTTLANHTDEYPDGVQVLNAELTEENVTYIDNHTAYLQDVLKAGKDVVLSSDLTINEGEMIAAPYGNKMAFSQNGGVFDGNGKTISCTIGGDNYAVMTAGGTIKNLTIDNGFRGIVIMNAKQTINIDNVVSSGDGVCYALNTAEGDSTQDLVVTNSTFNGWSSWALLKSASFTNCTFGQGTYYTNVSGRLAKPYVNTLFDGCKFCSKYYIDLSSLGNGQKVTLKNCTVNGVKLTALNWASLVAPESSCGDGQISIELKDGTYMTAENIADYIAIE